jgi:hypothetical protein
LQPAELVGERLLGKTLAGHFGANFASYAPGDCFPLCRRFNSHDRSIHSLSD